MIEPQLDFSGAFSKHSFFFSFQEISTALIGVSVMTTRRQLWGFHSRWSGVFFFNHCIYQNFVGIGYRGRFFLSFICRQKPDGDNWTWIWHGWQFSFVRGGGFSFLVGHPRSIPVYPTGTSELYTVQGL